MIDSERSNISVFGRSESFTSVMDQLDQLFSNADTGLAGSLSSVFSSLQTAVDDPTSLEARQVFLSTAENATQKFKSLQNQLLSIRADIGQQVEAVATQVSNLARDIADLNSEISIATNNGGQPNDLLDKRDETLRELAKLMDISIVPLENNSLSISIGSGQPLVVGNETFTLETAQSANDPEVKELVVRSPTGAISRVGSSVDGGMMSGLLSAQFGVIDNALNNLGRVALGLSDAINTAHNLGMDLENNLGGDLFTGINDASVVSQRTVAGANNSLPSDQSVTVTVSDISQLSVSDYQLTFTGPNTYVLIRNSDGKTNTALDPSLTGTLPPAAPGTNATVTVDGLTIDLSRPSGSFSTGDRFLLQPTRGFSNELAVQVNRAEELALASPIRTTGASTNTGTAGISAGEVTDTSTAFFTTTSQALSPPLVIQFTSPTTYNILDNTNPAAPVALVPPQTGLAYPPASPNGILPASFGFQVEITGVPANGDSFEVAYNTGGVLDNRAGLAMVKVQTTDTIGNNQLTLEAAYGLFTQEVGTRTSTARGDAEASRILLEQSQGLLQESTGVNLDEEAANLVQFEQAYNASAQVINVARQLFDTLIRAVG
ncbi:Flagellar hook-associated protein FlgK [gamma proteobacterium IMCC2047]|nr:Flagellar hook-associated protein FlgK [gamma proteobacterium IMCC2047]